MFGFKFGELLQDTDGGASAKRFAFFVFIALFCGMSVAVVLHGVAPDVVDFAKDTLGKVADIIKWLGAYILADKTPAVMRALKGDAQNRTVSTVTKETVEVPTPPEDKPPTGG